MSGTVRITVLLSSTGPVLEDWDIISPKDVIGSEVGEKRSLAAAALPFTQSLLSQVTEPVSQLYSQPVSSAFSQVQLLMQSCRSQKVHGSQKLALPP